MKLHAIAASALAALCATGLLAGQGCFGPIGIVGEEGGVELPRLKHGAYTDILFGAAGESIVWVVVGDTRDLCGEIEQRVNAGMPCFDGWGDVDRLHIRLPGRPDGTYTVEGGACFSEFGTLPEAAGCFEGDDGLGLSGFGSASADSGTISVTRWVELEHIDGRVDLTFPDGSWALGSFSARNCPALNNCCAEVGCF